MDEEFDVVIIGAGFGGPVAAKKCADAGLKTLILERSENVGDKVISGLTIPFHGFLFGPAFIRDGNPPFERPADGIINYIIKDLEKLDIDIDDSLKIPKPLSPVIAFGYNTYCKPFCEWEAKKAVESGAILRTSTTVVDFIKEEGRIRGIITDKGEKIRSKIVINAEGSQGLLAIKAGVRDKYPPETISLADTYDYEMSKEDIDRIFGYTLRFCWGWDEQKIAPPLGHGNGLMVWPYRNSLHFMQDQCLRMDQGPVPNLSKLFDEYHNNITSKLPWWKKEIAPRIKLRARLWEGFEISVGLNKKLRKIPNYTDGMMLIGDVAGLENTELCDGVPNAWFSAKIAADVAIEAIKANDTSKEFLKRYSERIKAHTLIKWSLSGTNRYNLRDAQKDHDEKMLKKLIHNGWGLGAFTHFITPLLKIVLEIISEDPTIVTKWVKMFFRYHQNWLHESYDFAKNSTHAKKKLKRPKIMESIFRGVFGFLNSFLRVFNRFKKLSGVVMEPLSNSANKLMKNMLFIVEPIYLKSIKLMEPITNRLSKKLVDFVDRADPSVFK
jgi:flavin-dependent dehydrogenase